MSGQQQAPNSARRNVMSYSQHMALMNQKTRGINSARGGPQESSSSQMQNKQKNSIPDNEVLARLRLNQYQQQVSGTREPNLINQTQATATWSSNSNLQNNSQQQHEMIYVNELTANSLGYLHNNQYSQQQQPHQQSDNPINIGMQLNNQVLEQQQLQTDASNSVSQQQQELYIMPMSNNSSMPASTVNASKPVNNNNAQSTNGGSTHHQQFDPSQILQNIRAQQHQQQQIFQQHPQSSTQGSEFDQNKFKEPSHQHQRNLTAQEIGVSGYPNGANPFGGYQSKAQTDEITTNGDEALNLEVNSTGQHHNLIGLDGSQTATSRGAQSYMVESHMREIEEQVVRRMQSQLQQMEDAKTQAEKRCETAQQQTMALLQQNQQLRQHCANLETQIQTIQSTHSDQVAALERELKLIKLQNKKSELQTSKSPIRQQLAGQSQSMVVQTNETLGGVNDLGSGSGRGGAPINHHLTEASLVGHGQSSLTQQQSHQRPKSSVNARNILTNKNMSRPSDQTNNSMLSARTGHRTRELTPQRGSTSQTRPGKLDLLKLAELYKEYPQQLERPQLITVDFYL